MFKSTEPCKGEGCNSFYIQNKRKHLCSNCIYKTTHEGKSQQQVYNERSIARITKLNLKRGLKEGPSKEAEEFSKALNSIHFTGRISNVEGDEDIVNWKGLKISSIENDMFERNKQAQDAITDIDEEGEKKFFEKENKYIQGPPVKGTNYKLTKSFFNKKQKPIKQKSAKQAQYDRLYVLTCKDMDYTTEPVCTGCLKYQGGDIKLSHSHIISRADCHGIGKPQLIYERKNLTYHCMDFLENVGCHRKWENPKERHLLKDYKNNVEIIKEFAPELLEKYTSSVYY